MRRTLIQFLGLSALGCALVGCSPPDFDSCQDLNIFEGLFSLKADGLNARTPDAIPFAVEASRQYAWIGDAESHVGVSAAQGKMVWTFQRDGKTYHAEYVRVE